MSKNKGIVIYFRIPSEPFLKTVHLSKEEKEFARMYETADPVFVNGVFLQSLFYNKVYSEVNSSIKVIFHYDLSHNPAVFRLWNVPQDIVNKVINDTNIYLRNRFGLNEVVFSKNLTDKQVEDTLEK